MIVNLKPYKKQLFQEILTRHNNNRCIICNQEGRPYKWVIYENLHMKLFSFLLKNQFPLQETREDGMTIRVTLCDKHQEKTDGDSSLRTFTLEHIKDLT